MPTATLMPAPRQRFVDNLGLPLANGMVFTFAAGTSDKLAAFTDPAGLIPHENPIRLDIRGEATIYWLGNYKVDVRTSFGVQLAGYPVDNFNAVDYAAASSAGVVDLTASLAGTSGASKVGFLQKGAAAGVRTVQSKLEETLSLEDFKAGQAGFTDVQAWGWANTACSLLNKSIELTRTYNIDGNISLNSGVSVVGKSRLNHGLLFSGTAQLTIAGTAGTKNSGNLTFSRMLLSHATSGTVLSMSEFKDIMFDDVEIYHASIAATTFSYLTFNNCIGFDYSVNCFGGVNTLNEAPKFLGGRGSNVRIIISNTTDVVIDNYHLLGPTAQISIKRGQHIAGLYPFVSISNTVVDSTDDECISLDGVSFKMVNVFTSGGRTNLKPGLYAHDCVESSTKNYTSRFCGSHGVLLDLCRTIDLDGKFADNKQHGVQMASCANINFSCYAGNTAGWYGGSYEQQFGIVDSASNCTDTLVHGCQLVGNKLGPLYLVNPSTKFGTNIGFVTVNSGTANVTTSGGSATIAHGLSGMPKFATANVVGAGDVKTQVTSVDATNITIRVSKATTDANIDSAFAVLWEARV